MKQMTYLIKNGKMTLITRTVVMLSFFLVLNSCEQDFIEENEIVPVVIDEELIPYFESFRAAAAIRGIQVDYDSARISGNLLMIDDLATGQCFTASNGEKEVRIDVEYWNGADELAREFLVFHELGHCFLGRPHLDTENIRGICTSMMHSGTSGCRNLYSNTTREDYLDELFSGQ